ncbi:thiamine biosynthesis protein ThiS [Gottschalkia acidurici 9a]|uniref:Thiamine biosynthesis protein ThiS n=1 Tax=Gottschalkia acidurici (strain ATCC 7906 / DSM 604 / BCRC 14475 / CIP 104303 / KCTC 5404 / NCIMB 10678 / 9a) TaxID=1128398 RepID=K0B0L1_GOTA9|nr:sulfur carrier protein ThiS [Gottschalkia acidurici]AFS78181.1 thiamine biosynthesis protein ThiS [Gottschalkia acidurici 9a]
MNIFINGQKEVIEESITLLDYLISKGLYPNNVVVEYNLNVLRSEDWANTVLKENDSLEVLSFVGGG